MIAFSDNYPHRCFLNDMLSFDDKTKETQLQPQGFVADHAGLYDDVGNAAWLKRRAMFVQYLRAKTKGTDPVRYTLPNSEHEFR